jgi:hypothetical protein
MRRMPLRGTAQRRIRRTTTMKQPRHLSGIFAMTVVIAMAGSTGAGGGTIYPGKGPSLDPTGSWSIEYREATKDTPHRLLLKDRRTGHMSPLFEFNRHVTVHWSPDGAAVAITDYSGSSESEVYVFHPRRLTAPIDVQQALIASLGRIPALYENGHRYFEASGWATRSTLRFDVHAHDARPGVEYRGAFEFDLRTGTVRQVRK